MKNKRKPKFIVERLYPGGPYTWQLEAANGVVVISSDQTFPQAYLARRHIDRMLGNGLVAQVEER
jgi:uncharacterized protein YegP (UPF0339 family)